MKIILTDRWSEEYRDEENKALKNDPEFESKCSAMPLSLQVNNRSKHFEFDSLVKNVNVYEWTYLEKNLDQIYIYIYQCHFCICIY